MCNHSCDSRCFPAPLPACGAAACPVMLFLLSLLAQGWLLQGLRGFVLVKELPCAGLPRGVRTSAARSNIIPSRHGYPSRCRYPWSTQVLCTAGDSLLGWSLASSCLCWAWSAKIWAKLSMEFIFFFLFFFPMGCAFIVVLKHS